jgi:hypothetical protein
VGARVEEAGWLLLTSGETGAPCVRFHALQFLKGPKVTDEELDRWYDAQEARAQEVDYEPEPDWDFVPFQPSPTREDCNA